MTDELVHLDVDRGIATITLDSPRNRNALSAQLLGELHEHLTTATADDGVRATVLTATGTVFCSGADLSEAGSNPPVSFADILRQVWENPKPVVARVNGHARAGGIGLVAACDVAIAPESATFAFTEVRIGLTPAMIAVVCLRSLTTRAARRYLLTGETFDAAAAAGTGLITQAVADGALDAATGEIVDAFRLGEPTALATTKALIAELPGMSVADGLAHASVISARLFQSEAAAEGIASFREKRPARWAAELREA